MKLSCALLLASVLPSLGLDQVKATSYLTLVSSLESDQAFHIIAELDFPGNSAALLFDQINETRDELLNLTDAGLGSKHPERIQKKKALQSLLTKRKHALRRAKNVLRLISGGKAVPPEQHDIDALQRKIQHLRASGLGKNHPEVKALFYTLQRVTD